MGNDNLNKTTNKVISLSDEEKKIIADIQLNYRNNIFELGRLDLMIREINQELKNIEEKRIEIFTQIDGIHKQETEFTQKLTDTYGEGTLNLHDGVFKPFE